MPLTRRTFLTMTGASLATAAGCAARTTEATMLFENAHATAPPAPTTPAELPRYADTATIRHADGRGRTATDWLDSRHSFSFANYRDPAHMRFRALRVINEDWIAPDSGFMPHGHRNMEIVTYVISGVLEHQDSTGGGGVIRPGEVQVMSAGHGIRHSEVNPDPSEPLHLLQIWLLPRQNETVPWYDQRDFGRDPGLRLLVSPEGIEGSLPIGQDVSLYRLITTGTETHQVPLRGRHAWIQVVRGSLEAEGTTLGAGDGLAVSRTDMLALRSDGEVEALIFDLV